MILTNTTSTVKVFRYKVNGQVKIVRIAGLQSIYLSDLVSETQVIYNFYDLKIQHIVDALDRPLLPNFELGDIVYDEDAQLYFNESTEALSRDFRNAINWGVEDLKSTGNYTKIDFLFWAPGPDQTLARTNLVDPSHKLTEEGSSGWEENLWWQGDMSRYLNLHWNPVDDGSNYVQNNAGLTVLTMQGQLYDGVIMGARGTGFNDTHLIYSLNRTYMALNSDQSYGTISRSSGINTATRTNSTTVNFHHEGLTNGSQVGGTATSAAPAAYDWVGLGWNNAGAIAGATNNKIACMIAHSGDIDVEAMSDTIKGIIARINGGYKITPLNLNISGMNPMDSCFYGNLSASLMIVCGGYDPIEVSQATDRVWTTPDGVTFTERTSMPFDLAHCMGGMRSDGYLWLWTNKQTGQPCCVRMNPADYSWTIVNTNLADTGESLEGRSFCQWGFVLNDTMYAATLDNTNAFNIQIWSSLDGDTWTYVSDFTTDGCAINSGWYTEGTTVRVAGGCLVSGGTTGFFMENIYESTDLCQTWNVVRSLPTEFQSAWPIFFKLNGSEFYSSGRKTNETIYEGGLYRWNGEGWNNTLISNFSGRHAIGTTQFNGEQYFINGLLFNDSHKLVTI